ncbi:hypothetical protein CMUST_09885 [Corynebacterium mustelae]|uniref:Uncharacterized protein n=2 Tax=Corynebacterium mustelae TaxID=571915 RepID=A0A0G3H3A3_9CORY|nr:hypothetical protein CMUST_09885 [Corynebacterium mustelae]
MLRGLAEFSQAGHTAGTPELTQLDFYIPEATKLTAKPHGGRVAAKDQHHFPQKCAVRQDDAPLKGSS